MKNLNITKFYIKTYLNEHYFELIGTMDYDKYKQILIFKLVDMLNIISEIKQPLYLLYFDNYISAINHNILI